MYFTILQKSFIVLSVCILSSGLTYHNLKHIFVSIAKYLPAGQVKLPIGHSAAMDTFSQYSHAINGEDEQLANDVNHLFSKILSADA